MSTRQLLDWVIAVIFALMVLDLVTHLTSAWWAVPALSLVACAGYFWSRSHCD